MRNLPIILSAAVAAVFYTGCKEDTIIKANLTPNSNINTVALPDTLTILSKTILDDSVVTSLTPSNQLVVHALGTVNDPYFGRTNAGIYFQVVPDKSNYSFSANSPTVDSAFVVLPFSGFRWGDTASTHPDAIQSYNVYRVTDDLGKDETYYSNTKKAFDGTPIGTISGVDILKLDDSVSVLGVNRLPHVRIKLTDAFKDELVAAAAAANDNAAFLSAIKGLYIESKDTTKGMALPYFALNGANDFTRMSIQFFFHEGSNTTDVKTAFFNFVTGTTAHYNKLVHNYTTNVTDLLKSPAKSDDVVLLQNLPGVCIDLRFPYIKDIPAVIINKAELIITQISLSDDPDATAKKFFEPGRIFPVGIDKDGKKYNVLDREPVSEEGPSNFVDGTKKSVTVNGMTVSQYTMNIPREIQRAIINKTEELHLRINGVQTFYGAYRLTAGGANNSISKISLKITYSKL